MGWEARRRLGVGGKALSTWAGSFGRPLAGGSHWALRHVMELGCGDPSGPGWKPRTWGADSSRSPAGPELGAGQCQGLGCVSLVPFSPWGQVGVVGDACRTCVELCLQRRLVNDGMC